MELREQLYSGIDKAPKDLQKLLNKFIKRVDSYYYVPSTEKEMNRTKVFAVDERLIEFVFEYIKKDYSHLQGYNFDSSVTERSFFWNILAFLRFSKQYKIKIYIINLAEQFLKADHEDLYIFRIFLGYIDDPVFKEIKTKVENHFLAIQDSLESYKWAKEIGLELPSNDKWQISFTINATEYKKEQISLDIKVYPIQGKDIRGEYRCWENCMGNYNNTVSGWWPITADDEIKIDYTVKYRLKVKPSLLNLKTNIKEVEDILGVKFDKKIEFLWVQGKVKKKNTIQKWLNS